MRDDLREVLAKADVPLVPGMATDLGRVLAVDETSVTLWDGEAVIGVDAALPIPDIEDAPSFLCCLAMLCARTGLDPSFGALWYRSGDDDGGTVWVLEGNDEVRTRDGDTEDPLLSLARALIETAGDASE